MDEKKTKWLFVNNWDSEIIVILVTLLIMV